MDTTRNELTDAEKACPYLLYNGLADALQRLIDQAEETLRLLGGEVR